MKKIKETTVNIGKSKIPRFSFNFIVKTHFKLNKNLIQMLFLIPNQGRGVDVKFKKNKKFYHIEDVIFQVK